MKCHRSRGRGHCKYRCRPNKVLCHFEVRSQGSCKFGDSYYKMHRDSADPQRSFDDSHSRWNAPPSDASQPLQRAQYQRDLAIFGIATDCDFVQLDMIRVLYKCLSLRWHPDNRRFGTPENRQRAEQRQRALDDAFERLSNYFGHPIQ